MEKWLLLNRITLHAPHVTPGNQEFPTFVVADFTNARLAFRNGTTVSARETPYAISIQLLVQLGSGLADILVQDVAQRCHDLFLIFYANRKLEKQLGKVSYNESAGVNGKVLW